MRVINRLSNTRWLAIGPVILLAVLILIGAFVGLTGFVDTTVKAGDIFHLIDDGQQYVCIVKKVDGELLLLCLEDWNKSE